MDHPAVSAALRDGYPAPEAPRPACPVCGAETYDVYYSSEKNRCVGCPACVSEMDIDEL